MPVDWRAAQRWSVLARLANGLVLTVGPDLLVPESQPRFHITVFGDPLTPPYVRTMEEGQRKAEQIARLRLLQALADVSPNDVARKWLTIEYDNPPMDGTPIELFFPASDHIDTAHRAVAYWFIGSEKDEAGWYLRPIADGGDRLITREPTHFRLLDNDP